MPGFFFCKLLFIYIKPVIFDSPTREYFILYKKILIKFHTVVLAFKRNAKRNKKTGLFCIRIFYLYNKLGGIGTTNYFKSLLYIIETLLIVFRFRLV